MAPKSRRADANATRTVSSEPLVVDPSLLDDVSAASLGAEEIEPICDEPANKGPTLEEFSNDSNDNDDDNDSNDDDDNDSNDSNDNDLR